MKSKTSKLLKLIDLLNKQYVENVNTDSIVNDVITKILKDLDPHSLYFTSSEYNSVYDETRGEFKGIGITYNAILDTPVILTVFDNSPAQDKGLIPGDMILRINDKNICGVDVDKIASLIKSFSNPRLEIFRKSTKDSFEVSLRKRKISLPTVFGYPVGDTLCYINIKSFSLQTKKEFMRFLDSCHYKQLKGIILDLRGNTGGTLSSAYEVLQEFFPEKTLLFYIKSKNSIKKRYISKRDGRLKDIPLVVLINRSTASASELIAGAVKDNDRGVIIGTRSFGKGLVQTEYRFSDGSVVRLTTAKYYTPSGRCLQKPYEYYNYPIFDFLDSLPQDSVEKFYTKNGRIIYGHGGITPDIKITDTLFTDFVSAVLLYTQILSDYGYTIDRFSDISQVETFVDTTFNIKDKDEDFAVKFNLIKNVFGEVYGLEYYNRYSPVFQKALEILSDTTLYDRILKKTNEK